MGNVYLELVNRSLNHGLDVDEILDQIIIVRGFTFYQFLNIIINEIPKLIFQLDNYNIQIIILDLLDTLLSSSHTIRTKDKDSFLKSKSDFEYNEKLVIEAIDSLISLSNNHFVMLSYDNSNNMVDNFFMTTKFRNVVEIDQLDNFIERKNTKIKDKKMTTTRTSTELLIKIRSNKSTTITTTTITYDYKVNNKISFSKDKISNLPSTIFNKDLVTPGVF